MAKFAVRTAAILGLLTVAACETSDLGRAGIGAGSADPTKPLLLDSERIPPASESVVIPTLHSG